MKSKESQASTGATANTFEDQLEHSSLLGFGLWWRARWQPAIHRAAQTGPSPRTLMDDIKRASQANDPQATR